MATREFSFAIELSGQPTPDDMLRDLVSRLLGHAGCSCDVVPGVAEAIRAAVARANTDGGACSVRFTAHCGELRIDVDSGAGSVWQWRQPIPESVGNDASV